MLRRARQGTYRENSFRETEVSLRDRYFAEKDGHWKISDEIKKYVDFIHLNLMDRDKIALLGSMDVILCRNVIIYFDPEGKRRVIGTFEEKLRPGGHLLLGHSESLINLSTSLELRHLKGDLVYRKPVPGIALRDPWHVAAEAAIGEVEGNRRPTAERVPTAHPTCGRSSMLPPPCRQTFPLPRTSIASQIRPSQNPMCPRSMALACWHSVPFCW